MYEDPQRDWMSAHRVIRELRELHPDRVLSLTDAILVAERQAQALLTMSSCTQPPVNTDLVAGLPAVRVTFDRSMPRGASGACLWDSTEKTWVIRIRAGEPRRRQRLSICHEFHHLLNYGYTGLREPERSVGGQAAREYVADYFAGCLLMPSVLLKRAWYHGIQDVANLADLFDVSGPAIEVRLDQLDLRPRFVFQQRSTT